MSDSIAGSVLRRCEECRDEVSTFTAGDNGYWCLRCAGQLARDARAAIASLRASHLRAVAAAWHHANDPTSPPLEGDDDKRWNYAIRHVERLLSTAHDVDPVRVTGDDCALAVARELGMGK